MNENQWKAGFAREKLTPQRDVYLGGYADADNEINLCRYPQDILGDVYVRVMALEQGSTRIVLVSLDACVVIEGDNIPEGTRQELAEIAGTSPELVFIGNTHNHQSFKRFEAPELEKIKKAVRTAVTDLSECSLLYQETPNDIGVNRRPRYCIAPGLPYDNRMAFLSFVDQKSGRIKGMAFNYPIHNTALGNGNQENWHYMSSELMGFAQQEADRLLEEENKGFISVFLDGFYGASGPQINGDYKADHETIRRTGTVLGRELAAHAGKGSPLELSYFRPLHRTVQFPINEVYGKNATQDVQLWGINLGDLAFLGVNCEPYSELGATLRAYSPFKHLILLGNTNGFLGYIPTENAFDSGDEERECRLNKTPFTRVIQPLFLKAGLAFLYELAGKRLVGIEDYRFVSVKTEGGQAVYTFEAAADSEYQKLALDFGFDSRDNCPCDFVLEAEGKSGKITRRVFQNNSVNFLGLGDFSESPQRLRLLVSSAYRGVNAADALFIRVRGIKIADLT